MSDSDAQMVLKTFPMRGKSVCLFLHLLVPLTEIRWREELSQASLLVTPKAVPELASTAAGVPDTRLALAIHGQRPACP